ncbi:14272_t:CDS:2 [Cetraspora pellucida]|uniref:14272_t:CDS:1 n=1 Tax=Cetraspora pellucida TaxID=1433469 RepID=A0ACA9LHE6_9GLOM|nr:14272_t:CDS:2 [Cetraspora pellucida]
MDSKFSFYFETAEVAEARTHTDGNQKYLVADYTKSNFQVWDNSLIRLLIPDDDSPLANHVKNNPDANDVFVVSLSNLKYQPDFRKIGSLNFNGLIVKDTSQVKKIVGTERPQAEITFQVISQQKKTQGADPDPKNYSHELVVKPFSLGIEGIPEISRIIFIFSSLAPGQKEVEKGIIKTELYNSKLLAESADVNDLDISSLREKTSSDNQPPKPSQNDNPPSPNPPKNSDNSPPSGGNKKLMTAGITILAVLALVIIYVRIFTGELTKGQKIKFHTNPQKVYQVERVGVKTPKEILKDKLIDGEIG